MAVDGAAIYIVFDDTRVIGSLRVEMGIWLQAMGRAQAGRLTPWSGGRCGNDDLSSDISPLGCWNGVDSGQEARDHSADR